MRRVPGHHDASARAPGQSTRSPRCDPGCPMAADSCASPPPGSGPRGAAAAGGGCESCGLGRAGRGSGAGTLLVEARVDYDSEEAVAGLRVDVQKGGRPLNGVHVRITSETGPADLAAAGDGEYRGAQP